MDTSRRGSSLSFPPSKQQPPQVIGMILGMRRDPVGLCGGVGQGLCWSLAPKTTAALVGMEGREDTHSTCPTHGERAGLSLEGLD